MKKHHGSDFNIISIVSLLLLLTLIACQSSQFSYRGKEVVEESRIVLKQGGPHEGVWKTKDFTFNYTYTREAGKLKISGDLILDDYYWNMEIMDFIFFRVNYIDSDGKLQDSKPLWSTTYKGWDYEWFIKREIDLPEYAKSIGFSYVGSMRQAGGGGVQLDLWISPLGK